MPSKLFLQNLRRHCSILLFLVFLYCTPFHDPHAGEASLDDYETRLPRDSSNKSIERKLIQTLLNRYRKYGVVGRPVNKSNVRMKVEYGLALIQILDLDENKQILRTNCWPRFRWKDSLLQWNPKEYGMVQTIRVFPDQLWVPDIKLYNFADERIKEQRNARVVVQANGDVMWIPQSLFKSTCPVHITYFPFDEQTCVLEFGSWAYDSTQVEIEWWRTAKWNVSMPYIDFTDYVKSNEWVTDGILEKDINPLQRKLQIPSIKNLRNRTYTSSNGTKTVKYFPTLCYRIRIRRNPSFFVSILVIPCILLSSLTLVLFWLPPESPAKMMLGMNIFVAFFILLLLLEETTPNAVKEFPLIGGYYCLNMVMITLSTFLAVTVINLYFRGEKRGPVPSILRRILIEGMGRLLLVRQNIPLVDEDKLKKIIEASSTSPCHHGKGRLIPNMRYNKFLTEDTSQPYGMMEITSDESPIMSRYGKTNLEYEVHEIKRFIRMYLNRQKDKERRNLVAMEWRCLSLILDRIFFCLYTIATSVAVIVLIPHR